jgi:hypothetical protein
MLFLKNKLLSCKRHISLIIIHNNHGGLMKNSAITSIGIGSATSGVCLIIQHTLQALYK